MEGRESPLDMPVLISRGNAGSAGDGRGLRFPLRRLLRNVPLLLAVVWAVTFGWTLCLDIPLIDPDEGRHAAIAQEMVERGDYVTPSLLGYGFFDKPVLFFWMQALSLRALGMHEAAVRLPGLLCGLLSAFTTALLGWRLFGRAPGLLAGLFQATLVLPMALAQCAVHDVALVPWTNLALFCCWTTLQSRDSLQSWRAAGLAGLCLGGAILTKGFLGPALVLVPCAVFVGIRAWGQSSARSGEAGSANPGLLRTLLQLGAVLGVAALVAAPWYVAMNLRHPGYAYYYLYERHILGYVTNTQRHSDRPWWYYGPILLTGGLPWVAYLPVHFQAAWPGSSRRNLDRTAQGRLFVWVWLAMGVVFLTVAHSKMPTYMLPIFPAISLLAADVWARFLRGELSDASRRLQHLVFTGTSLLSPALPIAILGVCQLGFGFRAAPLNWTLALGVSLLACLPIWYWRQARHRAALTCAVGVLAGHFAVVTLALLPAIAEENSARLLAELMNRGELPARAWFLEERIGSVVFYLRPELRANLRADEFQRVNVQEFQRCVAQYPGLLIVLPEREVEDVARTVALDGHAYRQVGRYRIYTADEFGGSPEKVGAVRVSPVRIGMAAE